MIDLIPQRPFTNYSLPKIECPIIQSAGPTVGKPTYKEKEPVLDSPDYLNEEIGTSDTSKVNPELIETNNGQLYVSGYAPKPTFLYRKYHRNPFIANAIKAWLNFIDNLNNPESARNYSETKRELNRVWDYIDEEEDLDLAEALVVAYSVLSEQNWKEWSIGKAKILLKLLKSLSDKEQLRRKSTIMSQLRNSEVEILPSEAYEENQKE